MKKALLRLHAAVFLWGFTGVLGRVITLGSVWLVWYRLLITVLSLWMLLFLLKKIGKVSLKSALHIGGIGFILTLHWISFYGSIKYANVTIALTCLSTTALISSILEPLILKKRFDAFEIFLGLFAIAGIVIIYNTHLQFSVGIIIGLVSALLTVTASVLNKSIVDKYSPEDLALYQLTGGFTGLTVLMPLFYFLYPVQQLFPTTQDWLWLVVLSWMCTILTYFLYIHSLKKLSAFTINLTLTLEPVYGIILAFIFYKENRILSNWFYAGFALITVAVAFHIWHLLQPLRNAKNKNRVTGSTENV
jgi:drug/metabolite transporter (DMT)-like permease